jgi:membrane dipeptidase
MLIVDAHLDLASNAVSGRDVLQPAARQPPDAHGIPTVGLPDLRRGRVALICGTLFCQPALNGRPGYQNADEAHAAATAQLNWYHQQAAAGELRLVAAAADLPTGAPVGEHYAIPTIVLMEGADPIRQPAEAAYWFARGVRIVGLAWRQTRYASGVAPSDVAAPPGGLTPAGRALVAELDRLGIILDISHLAEQAFWELLDLSPRPVIASHSNCRQIVPTARQLSDAMIRAIVGRGGVIGINFYDKFLLRPAESRRATLDDVMNHLRHICDIAGDCRHVGLGTDMDGGLGRQEIPRQITTSADLPCVADAARSAGFADADVAALMGGSWLAFFGRQFAALGAGQALPAAAS